MNMPLPPKPKDYKLLAVFHEEDFNNELDVALSKGWEPHGELVVSHTGDSRMHFSQMMKRSA